MKRIFTILLMFATIFTIIFCVSGCSDKSINLNDYVVFVGNGYDGYGTVSATFDIEKLWSDNQKAFKCDIEDEIAVNELKTMLTEALKGSVKEHDKVANGGEVEFIWQELDLGAIEEKYKVKLSYSNFKHKVTELAELRDIDLFANIEVKFEGVSPYGNAVITGAPAMIDINMRLENTMNLSNGEIVTISMIPVDSETPEKVKDFFGKQGYKVPTLVKEYKVAGLNTYVDETSDIPETAKNDADTYIKNLKTTDFESQTEVALTEMKLLGCILMNRNQYDANNINNYLYFVYNITITKGDINETYCFYARFTDAKISTEGNLILNKETMTTPVAEETLGVIEGEGFVKNGMLFQGYETYEAFCNAHIEPNKTDFSIKTNIKN